MKYTAPREMSALEVLKILYPDSSRRSLQGWIRAGRFAIDGKLLVKENTLVPKGATFSAKTSFRPPRSSQVPILFEDRYLIAIDKPAGLLSVPLEEGDDGHHALGLLRHAFESEAIVAAHRIDRETSGVLLFARGKKAADKLGDLFEQHDLKREYFAIVEGSVHPSQGSWNNPLIELPSFQVVPSFEGKEAITHFEVIDRSAKYSYLKLTLETGRKHQIRVHCQLAGHPIVGDKRYGSTHNPMRRLALHASLLEFIHPFTGKKVSFHSPLPKAFSVLGGNLRKLEAPHYT